MKSRNFNNLIRGGEIIKQNEKVTFIFKFYIFKFYIFIFLYYFKVIIVNNNKMFDLELEKAKKLNKLVSYLFIYSFINLIIIII